MANLTLWFPGQGSQYIGMGRALYDRFAVARHTLDEAEDTLGYAFKELIFNGKAAELARTEYAQPAILAVGMAAFRVFQQQFELEPALAAGHSLGEITALASSGAIRYADALQIVRSRGQLMQQAVAAGAGAMSAIIGLEAGVIESLCSECSVDGRVVVIANYNTAHQLVISGHAEQVRKVGEASLQLGAESVVPLRVSAPFHSPLMEPAVNGMRQVLSQYRFHEPKWPVLSSVTGRLYTGAEAIADALAEQLVLPVLWHTVMAYMAACRTTAIEMGPRNVLKNMARDMSFAVYGLDKPEDLEPLATGIAAERERYLGSVIHLVDRALAIMICTKNRNPSAEEYKRGVLEPYAELTALRSSLEEGGIPVTALQVRHAYSLLIRMMQAKHVPSEEQEMRYEQLFLETGHRNPVSMRETQHA
ncbi:malonyl CoA-acyl carrier protein transacylase [Paenibacillus sp. 598K]|uniref:ACP S-malonyltransferase n=1 Tax=Paenibacillus sp. 598K TaxID=1117987 RepID=UPI000FF914B8|nr:ACP S-malonyltransferase [Paenibacillus sp. 598K]GBF74623.1 malonyl CoA-acyl carrier protein transacylase [Paenibacillus sp. 598K]